MIQTKEMKKKKYGKESARHMQSKYNGNAKKRKKLHGKINKKKQRQYKNHSVCLLMERNPLPSPSPPSIQLWDPLPIHSPAPPLHQYNPSPHSTPLRTSQSKKQSKNKAKPTQSKGKAKAKPKKKPSQGKGKGQAKAKTKPKKAKQK